MKISLRNGTSIDFDNVGRIKIWKGDESLDTDLNTYDIFKLNEYEEDFKVKIINRGVEHYFKMSDIVSITVYK